MEIDDYLNDEEEILWRGGPPRGFILRRSDLFLVPFHLLFTGFAFFWTFIVLMEARSHSDGSYFPHDNPILLFVLIGILSTVFAVYFAVGRFFTDSILRAKTTYALSDKRAMIFRKVIKAEFQSLPLTKEVIIRVSGRRRGSIKFGPDHPAKMPWFPLQDDRDHPFTFERIEDVQSVYKLALQIQERN